jgi:hypothetical protein
MYIGEKGLINAKHQKVGKNEIFFVDSYNYSKPIVIRHSKRLGRNEKNKKRLGGTEEFFFINTLPIWQRIESYRLLGGQLQALSWCTGPESGCCRVMRYALALLGRVPAAAYFSG